MRIDVVDAHHDRVAVRSAAVWCAAAVLRVVVRDDDHTVAEGEPGPVPARHSSVKPKAAHSQLIACSSRHTRVLAPRSPSRSCD
jgi:hypothetical protein